MDKRAIVYPKGNEKEIWDEYASKLGMNFSNFARTAINSYIELIELLYQGNVDVDQHDVVSEVRNLIKENEELKQNVKELRNTIRNLTTDYWDKVWEAISTERFKTAEEILTDAGIIDSSMDHIQIQAEIRHLNEGLALENQLAKQEGRESPLEYSPGKGWKKRKP